MTSSINTGPAQPASFHWLPLTLIGVGLVIGVGVWAKWGFLVAFDAIRVYCFG